MKSLRLACVAMVLLAATLAEAQAGGPGGRRGGPRQQPCWQQAGISQGALAERRQILQQMWNDISLVCNNSALSAEQKKERVGEIREIARQKLNNVVTSQQELAMRQCQQQRQMSGGARNRRGGWGDAGLGRVYDNPCGSSGAPPSPKPEEAKPGR